MSQSTPNASPPVKPPAPSGSKDYTSVILIVLACLFLGMIAVVVLGVGFYFFAINKSFEATVDRQQTIEQARYIEVRAAEDQERAERAAEEMERSASPEAGGSLPIPPSAIEAPESPAPAP